jgi:hypothetical protein
MASPNPNPLSPTLADDLAPPRPGKRASVTDTGTTGHSALHTRQFGVHVSVDNVSGHPQSEHAKPVGTVYPDHGPIATYPNNYGVIPQRRARFAGDAEAHDYDSTARGFDTLAGGHFRAQAMAQAAQGDPTVTNLVGDQRSPAAQDRGRAMYRAAIDRAGHDTKNAKRND